MRPVPNRTNLGRVANGSTSQFWGRFGFLGVHEHSSLIINILYIHVVHFFFFFFSYKSMIDELVLGTLLFMRSKVCNLSLK